MSEQKVFPAYAGMIPGVSERSNRRGGVPRIRGDDPRFSARPRMGQRCSPHTRG